VEWQVEEVPEAPALLAAAAGAGAGGPLPPGAAEAEGLLAALRDLETPDGEEAAALAWAVGCSAGPGDVPQGTVILSKVLW